MRAAILTISDRGSRGEREDVSGPALAQWVMDRGVQVAAAELVADDAHLISEALARWADGGGVDLILTTGGIGVSPRDITPEATVVVLDRLLPGFSEVMRAAALQKSPRAMISRAVCGIRRKALILNLPGAPESAIENLAAVWEGVPHAVSKIKGETDEPAPRR